MNLWAGDNLQGLLPHCLHPNRDPQLRTVPQCHRAVMLELGSQFTFPNTHSKMGHPLRLSPTHSPGLPCPSGGWTQHCQQAAKDIGEGSPAQSQGATTPPRGKETVEDSEQKLPQVPKEAAGEALSSHANLLPAAAGGPWLGCFLRSAGV